MSGRNAKTNFPIPENPIGNPKPSDQSSELSKILQAKLRKCSKAPSPSLTCLRLDTESSHIGVWQKRAGQKSDSNWVMTVPLGKAIQDVPDGSLPLTEPSEGFLREPEMSSEMEEEERVALQMIEELLNRNCAIPSFGDIDPNNAGYFF